MSHEQTPLARCRGFGAIFGCSCGQYHIHLPGVTVHLDENGFDLLVKMVLQAKENCELLRKDQTGLRERSLQLVK